MSTELEKDITEIKVSVARVEEKLKKFDAQFTMYMEHENRIRTLENFKSQARGYAAAIGAVAGIITAVIIKLL